jgi:hypothetical protein
VPSSLSYNKVRYELDRGSEMNESIDAYEYVTVVEKTYSLIHDGDWPYDLV